MFEFDRGLDTAMLLPSILNLVLFVSLLTSTDVVENKVKMQ